MAISRRTFLKGAGAVAALAALEGCLSVRTDSEKILDHYRGDSEKLAAARFLIQESKMRVAQVFPAGTPEPVQHRIKPVETIDSEVISASDITDNVDFAFEAREKFPWTRDLDQHTFTHYVLPYRNGTTPLRQFPKNWRRMLLTKEGWETLNRDYGVKTSWDEVQGVLNKHISEYQRAQSPEEKSAVLENVIRFLNTDLWATKEGIQYKPSGAQEKTMEQILLDKGGRCSDLTHFSRMVLMAHGIPATTLRIPAWARFDDNHQVIAVKQGDGWLTFDALLPYKRYVADGPVPKVYVEEFGNWDAASSLVKDSRSQHPWFINFYLGTRSCLDLTRQFTRTVDVVAEGLEPNKSTYISVLNNFCSDGLAAVAVAKTDNNGRAVFKDMGCKTGILYFTENGAMIAHEDGRVEVLRGGEEQNVKVDGLAPKTYQLHVWDGGFRKVRDITVDSEKIELKLEADRVYAFKNPAEPVWSWSRPIVPRKDGNVERF